MLFKAGLNERKDLLADPLCLKAKKPEVQKQDFPTQRKRLQRNNSVSERERCGGPLITRLHLCYLTSDTSEIS